MDNNFLKINNYLWKGNTMYINKDSINYYHRNDTKTEKCLMFHTKAGLFSGHYGLPTVFTICEQDNKELFNLLDK